MTGGWSLDFTKTPAVNSIYADPQHPSALVLGHLAGGRAQQLAHGLGDGGCHAMNTMPIRDNP